MSGVAEGFGVIAIIIAVGFVLAHYGVLDAISQKALAGVVFYVAIPALLIDILSKSEITSELGKAFGVAVLSVLGVLAIWVPVARLVRGASVGHTVIGGMGASYVNGGNLGIPIAVYVIGDATMVIPIMLMQLIAYAPVALALLGSAESKERASFGSVALSGIRSPLAIGAFFGLLLSATGWDLPTVVAEPIHLIGGMAVAGALLIYGVSLRLDGRLGSSGKTDLVIVSSLKLIAQPTFAYLVARYVFGLEGRDLFGVTVMAALPTAQNVYVYALRYGQSVLLARDSIAFTTLLSVPTILVISALLN